MRNFSVAYTAGVHWYLVPMPVVRVIVVLAVIGVLHLTAWAVWLLILAFRSLVG